MSEIPTRELKGHHQSSDAVNGKLNMEKKHRMNSKVVGSDFENILY